MHVVSAQAGNCKLWVQILQKSACQKWKAKTLESEQEGFQQGQQWGSRIIQSHRNDKDIQNHITKPRAAGTL